MTAPDDLPTRVTLALAERLGGPENIRISTILAETGLTPPALYKRVANRNGLLKAARALALDALRDAITTHGPRYEVLRDFAAKRPVALSMALDALVRGEGVLEDHDGLSAALGAVLTKEQK